MAFRNFSIPNQTAKWDPADVARSLAGKGYLLGPGGLGADLDSADATVMVVRGDFDPHVPDATIQADLAAYVPSVADPVAAAQVEYRQAIKALRALDQNATAGQVVPVMRRALLASAALKGV